MPPLWCSVDSGDVGQFVSMEIDSNNNPAFAYYAGEAGCLRYGYDVVAGPACSYALQDLDCEGGHVGLHTLSTGSICP